jgi:hypothetical protein
MEQEDIDKFNDKMEKLGIKPEGSKVYNFDKTKEEIKQKEKELQKEKDNKLKNNMNVKDK